MFKYIYWTYRALHLKSELKLNEISLNGWYDTVFFNEWQFKDFEECNITKLEQPIPLEKYTWKLPVIDPITEEPTWEYKHKLTRFITLKYSDKYTNPEDLTKSIENSWALVNVNIFASIEEARQWLKANTSLQEVSQWKFLIYPETTWIDWEIIEAKFLTIE